MAIRNGKTVRGTSNKYDHGSVRQRAERKQFLLDRDGDGVTAPCSYCQVGLTFDTITVDRHPIPGCRGGTYEPGNIRPACGPCNSKHGGGIRRDTTRDG